MRHARIFSQPPHVSPESNLTHKTDPDLNLHWNKIVIISAPFNASNTYQKLYNALIQKLNDPAFLQDTPRITGSLSLDFVAVVPFFEFPPDDRLNLRAHIQPFAQGMLRLIARDVIYGTYHVAALTAFRVI